VGAIRYSVTYFDIITRKPLVTPLGYDKPVDPMDASSAHPNPLLYPTSVPPKLSVPQFCYSQGQQYVCQLWGTNVDPIMILPNVTMTPNGPTYDLDLSDAGGTGINEVSVYYLAADDEGGPVVYAWAVDENFQLLPRVSGSACSYDPILMSGTTAWCSTTNGSWDFNLSDDATKPDQVTLQPALAEGQYQFNSATLVNTDNPPASFSTSSQTISVPGDTFCLLYVVYGQGSTPPPPAQSGGHQKPWNVLYAGDSIAVLFGGGDAGGFLVNLGDLAKGIWRPQPIPPYPNGAAALDVVGQVASFTPTAAQLRKLQTTAERWNQIHAELHQALNSLQTRPID